MQMRSRGSKPREKAAGVTLDDPPAGDYLIQISATNLLQGGQDFALVVTGPVRAASPRRPGGRVRP
jgi:hypothetical protein